MDVTMKEFIGLTIFSIGIGIVAAVAFASVLPKKKPARWTFEDMERNIKAASTRLDNVEWRVDQNSQHIKEAVEAINKLEHKIQMVWSEVKHNGKQ